MTIKTLLLLATLVAIAAARDNSPLFTTEQCQVRTLDSASHAAMLADPSAVWLVDYYAPWCPHCRQFAPAWEKAAAFYADQATINIAAVDCTQNSEVCNREGIMGYPTIKLYHVPPESKEAVKMPPKSRKNTNTVIAWVEEQMQEHGMKTSAGTDDIDAHIDKINNGCEMGTSKTENLKETEQVQSDQSMQMKYKRLHDAGVAAVSTFENGFYVGTTVLEGERYTAALAWVDALAKSFPMEGNRVALEKLVDAMKKQNKWEQEEWNKLLTQWKKDATETSFPVHLFESKKDWAYCTTYTCGVWTLFHTLSVSEVKSDTALKPSEIMAAIRLFVKYFFSCEECQRHFMMANPESLLEKLTESDAEGPRAVAIWIWKMHNKVNKVLKYNQWPTLENCPKCYVNDSEPLDLNPARLHEEDILVFLKSLMAVRQAEKKLIVAAAKNGLAIPCDVDATSFLLSHPRGAYTAARTVEQTKIFDYEAHVRRLVESTIAMQTEKQLSPSAVEKELRPRTEETMIAAMAAFKTLHEVQKDQEYKINVLVCPSEDKVDGQVLGDTDIFCHVGLLPPLRSEMVKLEVAGLPRHNAAAKDSAWVRERKAIYDRMAPDMEEVILMDPATRQLLEGSQTNFYVIQEGAVHTAEEGILKGTVRSLVLEVCEEIGIPVRLSPPTLDDIEKWQGCFISSTSRLVLGAKSLEYEHPETKKTITRSFSPHSILDQITAAVRNSVIGKSTEVFK
ncbi:Thioredoxin [Phytophthora megakarya]|uniref:Sulfhydryl oxidase n=1 Tax=Phytophthora megakarya TaxID=4795 RepID=A0A225WKK0_9STRA|nr:Thioredoxin [Phytophthora megakarya]